MADRPEREVIRLYDAYTHGALGRREFLDRLARVVGSAAAVAALLPLLGNDYAHAETVAENDPRLTTRTVRFDTGAIVDLPPPEEVAPGALQPFTHVPFVSAYCASAGATARPAVVVVHENRGLNPHIKDVARRLALEGFAAYAVDMLSPIGGTPADEDRARQLIGMLDRTKTAAKLAAIVRQLSTQELHGETVAAVGFCWGGGMVNALAAAAGSSLRAGAVYYGRQGDAAEAARIKAAMLYHYAGRDDRINQGAAAWEDALRASRVAFQSYVYADVDHAFNNDTNAARYDKAAADLAWTRTIAFLKEQARG